MSERKLPAIERVTEADGGGAFVIVEDGRRLAEMVFTSGGAQRIVIDHTWVDDSLRGLGVARSLLETLVAWARDTKTGVIAVCPYAKGQFAKDESIRDVLVSTG